MTYHEYFKTFDVEQMASFMSHMLSVARLTREEIVEMLKDEVVSEKSFEAFFKRYKGDVPKDVALVSAPHFENSDLVEAFSKVTNAITHRPKAIPIEVNIYRKNILLILNAYYRLSETLDKLVVENKRYSDIHHDRSGKKWTPKEDEALIDAICKEDYNIHQLSTIFGRSPSAIKSHVTELVGVKKLTQEVAGRFVGKIDGQEMVGNISGTLYKK